MLKPIFELPFLAIKKIFVIIDLSVREYFQSISGDSGIMSKEVATDKGVITYTRVWLAVFLTTCAGIILHTSIFGWLAPAGETVNILDYSFEDYFLNNINRAISILNAIVTFSWLSYIHLVNKRKGTPVYWRREAEKHFKK